MMIELTGLSKQYKRQVVLAQANASFTEPQKIYALIGPSGSGKSTLFNILFALITIIKATINYWGTMRPN
nr:ATP-binding cassette domain-containing protein [Lapidilactobacillus luobeiensis]